MPDTSPGAFPVEGVALTHLMVVGGRGTLTGAALGAVLVNFGKTTFTTGALAPYWLFLLGGLFIMVTLLLPKGIVGTLGPLLGRLPMSRSPREPTDNERGVAQPAE
jgi:urea transport system permease protein